MLSARSMSSSTKIEAISRSWRVSPLRLRTGSEPTEPAMPVRPTNSAEFKTMPPPMNEPTKK